MDSKEIVPSREDENGTSPEAKPWWSQWSDEEWETWWSLSNKERETWFARNAIKGEPNLLNADWVRFHTGKDVPGWSDDERED